MAEWFWDAAPTRQQALYADRNGTLAKPWVLGPQRFGINAGAMDVSVFRPGDTLYIRGTHTWLNFDDSAIFTALAGLTIRGDYTGQPGHIRVLKLATCLNMAVADLSLNLLVLHGTSNTLIDACDIGPSPDEGIRVDDEVGGDNVTIQNCVIHDCEKQGIELGTLPNISRDGWQVRNNHIYNVGLNSTVPDGDCEGIGLQRVTNCVISGNHIHHADYGINLYESGNGVSHDVLISNNIVHDITSGPVSWPSRGIMMSGGSTVAGSVYNINVADNLVYRIGKEGIRLQAPSGATGLAVTNNVILDVNTEHGTPDTEFIVAPAAWAKSLNRFYNLYRS
jgi:parallel beta-helix repeat protein